MTRRFLVAAIAVITALPLAAQNQNQNSGSSFRLNFLAGYLSLTDAQKTQAQTIFTAADTALQTANGTLTAARTALNASIKNNPADAEVDRLAAAVGTVEGQIAAIRTKAEVKFYALLTAEQKTKYDQLLSGNGQGAPGSGFGRRRWEVTQ